MRRMLAVLTAAVVVVLGLTAPSQADDGPLPDLPTSPDGDPPGANDWSCAPTAQRPTPVILVHGTLGDRKHLLERMSRKIKEAGFCIYSLDYGNRATEDIRDSALELKAFTERVLDATGAAKVSIVGHSQGGMMPRYTSSSSAATGWSTTWSASRRPTTAPRSPARLA
jgi:triacylglycerol lipase